jgi:plastocyanin
MIDTRPSPTRARRLVVTVLAAGLALGLAACGDDGDDDEEATDTPSEEAGDGGSGDATLEVTEFEYEDVTVPAGGALEVVNSSGGPHTVTADDGAFDEELPDGETITVTMPAEAGEYPYHCEIHPSMTATITVE